MKEKTLESRIKPVPGEKPGRVKPLGIFGKFKDRCKSLLLAGAVSALASCTFDIRVTMTKDASVPQDAVATDVNNPGEDAKKEDARQDAQMDSGEDAIQDDASASDAQDDAQKPWWDPNWPYCRKINLYSSFPADYSHRVSLVDPAHVNADLSDLRFLEGSCEIQDLGVGVLGSWDESVINPGESLIWFRSKTANVASVAMFYGNPGAPRIFDGNATFIAFGKNSGFGGFTEVDTTNGLSIDSNGVNFTGYPFRTSYLYKDVGNLTEDFIIDFSIKYTYTTDCYPYLMVAVADTLTDKFINVANGFGYVRQSCGASPQKSVGLRVRQSNAFVEQMGSSFVPSNNTTYHVRIRRTGNSVNVAFYPTKTDRDNGTNALVSITSNKVPSANFRYIYVPIGLDAPGGDATYWTNGTINDVIVRKAVSPEPVQVMDPEQTY